MLKRLLMLLSSAILLVLVTGFMSLAEETKPHTIEMTLDEAKKYASEHNKTLIDLNDQCTDLFETYDNTRRRTESTQYGSRVNFASMDDYALYKGYTLAKSKYAYDELVKTKELTEQTTHYNIEKLAYEIEQAEKDLEYLNKTAKKLEKDLVIAKLRFLLLMASQNQVDQAETALSQINTKVKLMEDALKMKINALKALMGIDRNTVLKINAGEKKFEQLGEVGLTKLKEEALKNRLDALKLTHSYNTKKMDYELYEYFKAYIVFNEYKSRKDDYEKADATYQNELDDIRLKVENAYEAVVTSENEYADALEAFNNTTENHRINELRYSLGMISQVDLMSSELALVKAEADLKKALDNSILVKRKFTAAYTVGDLEAVPGQ